MRVDFDTVRGDVTAMLGESPVLSPILDTEEEHSVLTIDTIIKTVMQSCAEDATQSLCVDDIDDIAEARINAEWKYDYGGYVALPADFFLLVSFRMPDWKEALTVEEPSDSLRRALGKRAPLWLVGPSRPMVRLIHASSGQRLLFDGSVRENGASGELVYVRRPHVDSDYSVSISRAAYMPMLERIVTAVRDTDG